MTECKEPSGDFPIGSDLRELVRHGELDFPAACYQDRYYHNEYPWHWHEELELGLVETGKMIARVDDRRYTLTQGEGLLVNSGVLHSFSSVRDSKCVFLNIVFHPALLYSAPHDVIYSGYVRPLTEEANLSHLVFRPAIPWQKDILDRLEESRELFQEKGYGYEIRVRNSLSEILLAVCENCREEFAGSDRKNRTEVLRVRRMLEFVRDHYTGDIRLGQIASSASVSERECLRCFQKVLGISPLRYVTELRLQRAKRLLDGSTLSLLEIGGECGFQNQSYFARIFRERVGCTPSQYRKHAENQ